jgi:hypothetical protein
MKQFRWVGVFLATVGVCAALAAGCGSADKTPDSTPPENLGTSSSALVQVPPNGGVTTIAGLAGVPGNDDDTTPTNGMPTDGRFNDPAGVAVASDGTIYIADWMNNSVRRTPVARLLLVGGG